MARDRRHPLIQPTDVARVGTPELDAVKADNDARKVVLDDGASTNFLSATGSSIALPWLSPTNTVRVGAPATLNQPVILDYRNSAWKFQPTHQVTDEGTDVVTFGDTRTPAPEPVGGDLTLATFNVLNYFSTTGEEFVAAGGACTYYNDRVGDPVTDRSCTPDGPRGAAQVEDLQRQQDKIVAAINALNADVVSLEEIENSVKLGPVTGETDRDAALATLVDALNAAAGSTRWAYAPSPDPADLPDLADQDVIRTAFIYDPSTVVPVGGSRVLVGDPAFSNAREPLAQVFKAVGGQDADGFAVVVNHFKSKGDSSPPATGDNANGDQGAFNGDRTRQAAALVDFADGFAADRGVTKVFLTGDFNSYTQEDPMHVLYDAGFTKVASDDPRDASYSFSGLSGSLDHVLANDAALTTVTGADVWEINANEAVAFEYSRRNYNLTDFYAPDVYRASDHNPEVVGMTVPHRADATVRARVSPKAVKVHRGQAWITVQVRADGRRATGEVEAYVDGAPVASGTLVRGTVRLRVGPFDTLGPQDIEIRYLGNDTTNPATATVTVRVRR
ncbi:ExeM/NucH family extracellular endonuclease [Nocardioides sp.]|uniref:ExeM/NucH family extracellular endonuclease n=1 Tax=Nocardioides sp. TaxID=35761 RepID=UPI003526DAE8